MNAMEKFKELYVKELAIPTRIKLLAYIQLHMENGYLHPDGYWEITSGYCGWHVSIMDSVHKGLTLPENFHYPCAFLRLENTLDTFDALHADDDEDDQRQQILSLRSFFADMETGGLQFAAEEAMKLYLFHATEDEDNEYVNDLRDISDVLTWICQHNQPTMAGICSECGNTIYSNEGWDYVNIT